MTEDSVESLLLALASTNRHERAFAAIKLGEKGVESALPKLRALVDEDDDIVAMAGMYACRQLGEDRTSIKRFISALRSGEEEIVQQAVHTICRLGTFMVPKLKSLLHEPPETAMLALELLGEIGGDEARQAVFELRTDDERVRGLAEELLEDWDDDNEDEF